MCTVSLIPALAGRGARLVVNRDERWTRPTAWAPQQTRACGVPVLAPVDSESLGTWIAASGAGLIYALLNLNRDGGVMPRARKSSRGHVIPALTAAGDCDEVISRLAVLDAEQFAPFRLIVTDGLDLRVSTWNGVRLDSAGGALQSPVVLSSSSLGDGLVEAPRRALFEHLLALETDPWRAQDRLHQHAWPHRRHLSVLMTRAAAGTVSRTAVVMERHIATMRYTPVIDAWMGPVTEARMAVRPVAAAR
jgi:uncharacterized protein with NRDE domain